MDYTVKEEKQYEAGAAAIFEAAVGAVGGLEGKLLKQDADAGAIEAQFNKAIHGKVLGDRTRMEATVSDDGHIQVAIYPIDPMGRKMQFGARKGVAQQVMGWFFAHLEHRLK